jgi:hypothetical protein
MTLIMRLIGSAAGIPTDHDGQWVVEYDPTRPGTPDSQGRPMLAHIVTTSDPRHARRFTDIKELHAYWLAESGLPFPRNRPLTAYTIALEPAPEDTA